MLKSDLIWLLVQGCQHVHFGVLNRLSGRLGIVGLRPLSRFAIASLVYDSLDGSRQRRDMLFPEGAVLLSELRKNKGERPYNGCSPCSGNGHVPCDSVVVTDEHHTNCNTRSPRRFRLCRNRGPPCGNQSEPAESRR